ncbi:MAG: hypothetical protein SGILL_008107 [Bacillariaceae sp.]
MKKRSLKKVGEKEDVAKCILAVSQCLDLPIGTSTEKTETPSALHPQTTSFQKQFLAYSMGSYSFSIAKCANHLGQTAEPRHIFAALRRLQSSNELEFHLDTSEKGRIFHLKVTECGARMFANDDYVGLEENLTNAIHQSFTFSSSSSAEKVLDMHYIMHQVAAATDSECDEDDSADGKSRSLQRFQELTQTFFAEGLQSERVKLSSELLPASFYEIREKELMSDVRVLAQELPAMYSDPRNDTQSSTSVVFGKSIDYTTLAIAKFLHGIDSPRTPYLICRNNPMFGRWRETNFETVKNAVAKALQP